MSDVLQRDDNSAVNGALALEDPSVSTSVVKEDENAATPTPPRCLRWFSSLVQAFGLEFVLYLSFSEHLLRGFLTAILAIERLAYLQLKVDASLKGTLLAVSDIGWSLKPLFGMVSDVIVIHGHRRKPWVLFSAALSTVGCTLIATVGPHLSARVLCLCFMAVRLQIPWTDLMTEATYSAKIRQRPANAADLLTWIFSGVGVATTAGILVVGPLSDTVSPFTIAMLGIPAASAVIFPTYAGWMGEELHVSISTGVDVALLKERQPYFLCTSIMVVVVIASSVAALHPGVSHAGRAGLALSGAAVMAAAAAALLPAMLWKPMLYLFVANLSSVNTSAIMDNFYLDPATPEQAAVLGYPVCVDCPHFSRSFYVTVGGLLEAGCTVLGSVLFNTCLAGSTYRKAFAVTQVLSVFANSVDIVQLQRWNHAVGVPDHLFMLGKVALQSTCGMLNFMPSMVLFSKLCPEGVESSVFALLAGFTNFGDAVSSYVGSYTLQALGLGGIGKGQVDNFSNAWKASLLNACIPIAILALLPLMIPDANMADPLVLEGDDAMGAAPDLSSPASNPNPDGDNGPRRRRRSCRCW